VARESLITQEGLEKLREELEHMTTVKRREVAERIKDAREFGDIMENAEYDDAKNEQALLEQRIAQLEERVRRATVVDEKQVNTDVVSVGVRVYVKDQK
jgi:transcription elongation factor GreA